MINIETEDNNGNRLKVEVTELRTIADALKEIKKLTIEVTELKKEIEKLKDGTDHGK